MPFLANLRQGKLTAAHLRKLGSRVISGRLVPPVDSVTAFYDNHNVTAPNISCAHPAANATDKHILRFSAKVSGVDLPQEITHAAPAIGKSAVRKKGKTQRTRSKADLPLSHLDLYTGCLVSFKAPGGNANNSLGATAQSAALLARTHRCPLANG